MKRIAIIILGLLFTVSCATPHQQQGPHPGHGFSSAIMGFAHLVLSPVQIAAGLLEGISSMPYYLATDIHEINKGMIEAQARITVDDTYESAYGKRLSEVPGTGDTGEVFRRMKHATTYFQKVLKCYGVHDANQYILTSIDTANSEGYTLFAVVRRPADSIKVMDKYNNSVTRHFTRSDRLFYEPFEKDIHGRPVDTIVDWAGLPREDIKTQKAQAVLITIAANSVLNGKTSPDYWEIERRWIDGSFAEIAQTRMNGVRQRMNL